MDMNEEKPAKESLKSKTLICFDFDKTLVNGHFHSALQNQGLAPADASGKGLMVVGQDTPKNPEYNSNDVVKAAKDLLDNPETGIKNPEQLKQTFDKMLAQGHAIAITSFTQYPDVVKPALQVIGLSDEQISKIHIIGGFPSHGKPDNSPDGKKEHIDKAMELAGVEKGNYKYVMLVDDSANNINKAREMGITTIEAPKGINPNPKYLQEAQSRSARVAESV